MTRDQIVRPHWERVAAIFWLLIVLVLSLVAVSCLTACGAKQCKRVPITITSHPLKPKPAGRVTVGCDGEVVSEILADEVLP
jgi:hypothetical protein